VQYVYRSRQRRGVRGSVRVILMILHELHDLARHALAKRSCSFWHISVPRIKERGSEDVLHVPWHGPQVLSTAPDELERFALCRVHGEI
jgi:hypothetical protein